MRAAGSVPASASRTAYRSSSVATRLRAKSATASGPAVRLEEAEHLDGERVVVGLEGAVSGVGDDVGAGGTAAAAAGRRGHVLLDGALLDEHVEVAADGGGRQLEVATELGSGDRAVGGDHVQHPRARARLERRGVLAVLRLALRLLREKHHTIVT